MRTDALRRNSLSLGGLPGLINVPVAGGIPSGMLEFALNSARMPSLVPNLGTQRNAYLSFGFLPRVTIGARAMVAEDTLTPLQIRDLGTQIQLQVMDARGWMPALAVGIQDYGGMNAYFRASYAVASRTLFDRVRVSAGYGTGPVRLKGAFGGVEAVLAPWATAMGDYDGEHAGGGVRIFPFPSLADRAGVQPRLDLAWRRDLGFALAGGVRASLGGSPATQPRAPRGARPDTRPNTRSDTGVSAIRSALAAEGLENVRAALGAGGETIGVEYENRRYNRDELDALGVVMRIVAARAPASVTRMRVTILRVDLPVLAVESAIPAFADFVAGRLDDTGFGRQLQFPPIADARTTDDRAAANPSRYRIDLFVRPRVETVLLSDFGVVDSRMALLPDAYVQLGRGLVLNGRRAIPVRQTINYPEGIEDPNADRLLLHQALPLEFGPGRRDWRAITQLSVGRFGHDEVGISDEVAISPGTGIVTFGGTLGVVGRTFGTLDRAIALATTSVRYTALDLTASLTAGRFRNGDAGALAELRRLFGNTELAFYTRATEFEKMVGLRVALPLAPARELKPALLRPRFPDLYAQEAQSSVFGDASLIRRDVARQLDTDRDIARAFWDRDRLQPATVLRRIRTLRAAATRGVVDSTP